MHYKNCMKKVGFTQIRYFTYPLCAFRVASTKPFVPADRLTTEVFVAMVCLYDLCECGDVDAVKEALELGGPEEVNLRGGEYHNTCLLEAAFRGDEQMVSLLLDQPGIRVNDTDQAGCTALHWAAANGHTGVVVMLAHHPATDCNIKCDKDYSALMVAVAWGVEESVRVMVELPMVDLNTTSEGKTLEEMARL